MSIFDKLPVAHPYAKRTPVVIPPGVRRGAVRTVGNVFHDDVGPINLRGITFFTLPWGVRGEPARYLENLLWVVEHGFDFVRVFGKVGGSGSWNDREYSVETDPAAMAETIDVAFEHGLKTCVALIADNFDGRDPVLAAEALVSVMQSRREKVLLVECANEDNMPDEAVNLRRVHDVLRSAFPDLPLVARCGDAETADAFARQYPYASVMSVHSDRQPPPERQARALWDLGHETDRPAGNFEPPGPWSSVATMDNPMHLAVASAAAAMHGFGIYVFHAGAGIRTGGQWDRNRGLPSNFWEQEVASQQAQGVINARDLLPPDSVAWTRINGHWPNHPMPATWVWSDGFPQGVSRSYAIERDGEFYNLAIAVKGESRHPIARDCHIQVFNPLTAELVDERTLRGGQIHFGDEGGKRVITGDGDTYVLRGPDAGGLWGYIIRGRYL